MKKHRIILNKRSSAITNLAILVYPWFTPPVRCSTMEPPETHSANLFHCVWMYSSIPGDGRPVSSCPSLFQIAITLCRSSNLSTLTPGSNTNTHHNSRLTPRGSSKHNQRQYCHRVKHALPTSKGNETERNKPMASGCLRRCFHCSGFNSMDNALQVSHFQHVCHYTRDQKFMALV